MRSRPSPRSAHDAVIAKSVDGVITAGNDGAFLLYGQPASSVLGRTIETIIPAGALIEERARHARVAEGGAESGYRCVHLRAVGSRVEVVISRSPICDDQDRVVGVASLSRPVNARTPTST